MAKPRRAPIDVQAAIIKYIQFESATLNKIFATTRLNRQSAAKHIGRMISKELIQVVDESKKNKHYVTTEEGKRWLMQYQDMLDEEK